MAEIAGLILSAFPLMISAMEHYKKTAEVWDDWWSYKQQYTKFKRALECEKLAFEENFEELLGPIVRGESELRELLKDSNSPAWKEPELEEQLRERLPKSYDAYMDIMKELEEVMEKLKDKLGVGKLRLQDTPCESVYPNSFSSQW
jgi:hypothetical protein